MIHRSAAAGRTDLCAQGPRSQCGVIAVTSKLHMLAHSVLTATPFSVQLFNEKVQNDCTSISKHFQLIKISPIDLQLFFTSEFVFFMLRMQCCRKLR